ncbi:MAG TPA: SDR family oxidoreductase [Mycobacteriales bacterium]|nr:SDR family oxidoreductase [Mycobacteriales bacterium]
MALTDQRVLILGGTSGIGRATAELAAQQGAEVVVVSRNPGNVDRAVKSLPATASGHAVDLTDVGAVEELLRRVGAVDHLVFTAGESLALGSLESMDLEVARQFFALRYFGALTAVRSAAPLLRAGGSIVLTTGVAAVRPRPGWTVAASICAAVEGLVRALAVELAPIRVNAVSPGLVRSPLWASMDDASREQLYRDTAATIPVGRAGEPADIAQAYLFLMTQGFATGSVVTVDGGAVLV